MSNFDSLTLALEDWFDTKRCDMPDAIRRRVEIDFFPMPWDEMTAEQRRSVALQVDYQHDPASEQDRQFWWDFFARLSALKAQIAQWEATSTPTAEQLALRETRLKDLQQELARMETHERQARGDYYPQRAQPDTDRKANHMSEDLPILYVAYPKALHQLVGRLGATPEELAAWILMGPKAGGLAAYLHANELDPPPRFQYGAWPGSVDDHDYVSPLMACWFRADEIARFSPVDRYITGSALLKRWNSRPGLRAEAFIRAKIRESRLQDLHPIYGGTLVSFPDESYFPPLMSGLFPLAEIQAIEAVDFAVESESRNSSASDSLPSSELTTGLDAPVASISVARGPESPLPNEVSCKPANTSDGDTTGTNQVAALDLCAVFRAMPELNAGELTIAFVGDKAESGFGANNMLSISARGTARRIPLASLDLVNRKSGTLNPQGAVLLGLIAKGQMRDTGANAKKVSRLRSLFKTYLGLDDPFTSHREGSKWRPRFTLEDRRGAVDERAKQVGIRNSVSLDQLAARGFEPAAESGINRPFDSEDDAADRWLKENDCDGPA